LNRRFRECGIQVDVISCIIFKIKVNMGSRIRENDGAKLGANQYRENVIFVPERSITSPCVIGRSSAPIDVPFKSG
jgi:hypothetical protein